MSATLTLEKIASLSGEVKLIGSKSLTNRALLLSALSRGTTKLNNILRSDDSAVMIAALKKLGVEVVEDDTDDTVVIISGVGGLFSNHDDGVVELFLGNAGTAMRPLCAALALSDGCYKLTGEPRMYERPIGDLVDALRVLGAHIEYLGADGYPPLLIKGHQFILSEGSDSSTVPCSGSATNESADLTSSQDPASSHAPASCSATASSSGLSACSASSSFVSAMARGAARAVGATCGCAETAASAVGNACDSLSDASVDGSESCCACEEIIELEVAGNTSSQFISALLMIGALTGRKMVLKVKGELISKPYVNLTCELLKRFGVEVKNNGFASFEVLPQQLVSPSTYLVEGDASGATYFLAGAAISGEIKVTGVGRNSIQGDSAFVQVLEKMGAMVETGDDYIKVKSSGSLHGIDIDMNDMPDAAMTLVPMALFTSEPIIIRNIESWRVKETDRIAAMATEMRKLGCEVEEGKDYIKINGNVAAVRELKESGSIPAFDTYNDHRMAMCMSLTTLFRTVVINDPDCCRKTFPDYFERLASVTVR